MRVSSLPIIGKVAVLGSLLSLALAAVGAIGLWATTTLKEDIATVSEATASAAAANAIDSNVAQLRRWEMTVLADQSAETVRQARRAVAQELAQAREHLSAIAAAAGERRRAHLPVLRQALDAYAAGVERAFSSAEQGEREATIAAVRSNLPLLEAAEREAGVMSSISKSVAEEQMASAFADGSFALRAVIVLTAVALVSAAVLVWLIGAREIARPLKASVSRLGSLAEGDTTAPIPGAGRRDEIGALAAAMVTFRDVLIRQRESEARERGEAEAKAARAARMVTATRQFEADAGTVVETVAAAATELESTASALAAGAEETSRQATAVAAAAEQASANVQTVAAASEELAASIREISRQVAESTRMAEEAVAEAKRTDATVESLAASAQKIGDVVRLINDIAGQTNLLALNATIEAARAGEAGKGFAVVASEVKNLASQTAKATEEISAQISAVQQDTARAVEAIRSIGQAIDRINTVAASIAAAVEEQGAATTEIARNVQQAAQGTGLVSANITSVQQVAADAGANTAQVQRAAAELSRNAETLRANVAHFLAEVKAA
ncbi:MAG: HAMP domain-containing methyl-accepting chemotaxis protein [Acetobacteraceae bacterium]